MIWYDARTSEPVAPGAMEDGGPPSIDHYPCWFCGERTEIRFRGKVGICRKCNSLLMVEG